MWGVLESVLSNRGVGITAKKYLYEGLIVPTALYGAEARGMRSGEKRKLNLEMAAHFDFAVEQPQLFRKLQTKNFDVFVKFGWSGMNG